MERLRGKVKNTEKVQSEPSKRKKYEKLLKPDISQETRSLDTLVSDFKKSAGDFEQFHSTMNGREKILFKGYLESMRKTEV